MEGGGGAEEAERGEEMEVNREVGGVERALSWGSRKALRAEAKVKAEAWS